jgi:hypothetical protein
VKLDLLPVRATSVFGRIVPSYSLILPTFALGLVYTALLARITRASLLEVLGRLHRPPMRRARPPPCSSPTPEERRGAYRHDDWRRLPLLIGGVVITESVFALPGLGRLTVDAILRRDYSYPGRHPHIRVLVRPGEPPGGNVYTLFDLASLLRPCTAGGRRHPTSSSPGR